MMCKAAISRCQMSLNCMGSWYECHGTCLRSRTSYTATSEDCSMFACTQSHEPIPRQQQPATLHQKRCMHTLATVFSIPLTCTALAPLRMAILPPTDSAITPEQAHKPLAYDRLLRVQP